MGYSKKKLSFFKIAKGSKIAVKCDWNGKISQNVKKKVFLKKNRWVFREKILNFFEIAKGSKIAVKCDWNSKISQNVQKKVFF